MPYWSQHNVIGQFADGELVIRLIEGVRWQEQRGRVVEIQNTAVVYQIPTVHQGTEEMVQAALAHSQMPRYGQAHPRLPTLILEDRTAYPRGVGIVSIELVYRLPGADVDPPPGEQWLVSGGTAVEQIETQLDRQGFQITVQHAGDVQGGTITPFEARDVLTLEAPIQSANPWALTRGWTNYVNALNTGGQNGGFYYDPTAPPRTWLVSGMSYQLINEDKDPMEYRFRAELRNNPLGHDPQVVYIDPSTGRPPPGLIVVTDPDDPNWGVAGAKTVPWHSERDFTELFGE